MFWALRTPTGADVVALAARSAWIGTDGVGLVVDVDAVRVEPLDVVGQRAGEEVQGDVAGQPDRQGQELAPEGLRRLASTMRP